MCWPAQFVNLILYFERFDDLTALHASDLAYRLYKPDTLHHSSQVYAITHIEGEVHDAEARVALHRADLLYIRFRAGNSGREFGDNAAFVL